MSKRSRKRPPVSIQRVNKMLSRIEMATALELYSDGDRDCLDLATLLRSTNKDVARCSPHTLAQKIGLPYSRIIALFKEMKRAEAVVAVAQRLPQVAEGIAHDAESREVTCEACSGEGIIVICPQVGQQDHPDFKPAEFKKCIPCEGTGKVLRSGDPMARKQVLEMMGLAGSHATPISAPGANILIASGQSLEETLRQAKGGGNGATVREVGLTGGGEAEVRRSTDVQGAIDVSSATETNGSN